jgi:hypothetical protein
MMISFQGCFKRPRLKLTNNMSLEMAQASARAVPENEQIILSGQVS